MDIINSTSHEAANLTHHSYKRQELNDQQHLINSSSTLNLVLGSANLLSQKSNSTSSNSSFNGLPFLVSPAQNFSDGKQLNNSDNTMENLQEIIQPQTTVASQVIYPVSK